MEGTIADARHTVGDNDRGQLAATSKSRAIDGGNTIGVILVYDGFRNNHFPCVYAAISHNCMILREVVVDAIYLGIVGV
jgi:hypothetical protein